MVLQITRPIIKGLGSEVWIIGRPNNLVSAFRRINQKPRDSFDICSLVEFSENIVEGNWFGVFISRGGNLSTSICISISLGDERSSLLPIFVEEGKVAKEDRDDVTKVNVPEHTES
ncbi:hypothetical protein ANTRET_LOCUS443 [Anthophora retusa]